MMPIHDSLFQKANEYLQSQYLDPIENIGYNSMGYFPFLEAKIFVTFSINLKFDFFGDHFM